MALDGVLLKEFNDIAAECAEQDPSAHMCRLTLNRRIKLKLK